MGINVDSSFILHTRVKSVADKKTGEPVGKDQIQFLKNTYSIKLVVRVSGAPQPLLSYFSFFQRKLPALIPMLFYMNNINYNKTPFIKHLLEQIIIMLRIPFNSQP